MTKDFSQMEVNYKNLNKTPTSFRFPLTKRIILSNPLNKPWKWLGIVLLTLGDNLVEASRANENIFLLFPIVGATVNENYIIVCQNI